MTREEHEAMIERMRPIIGGDVRRLTVNEAMTFIAMNPEMLQDRQCVRWLLECTERSGYDRGHAVATQTAADEASGEAERHFEQRYMRDDEGE